MALSIANAPCSWGVEYADDPRNPAWTTVLDEARDAGYRGIELGPIGFMPENPSELGDALAARDLTLVGGVLYRPFHDPNKWSEVEDAAWRTCEVLKAHGAERLVLIDSIAPERAVTAGRSDEAPRLPGTARDDFHQRLRHVAKMGTEQFGLTVTMHAHVAGYCEFEDELDAVLDAIDQKLLGICLDTGHSLYAGFDPVALYRRYASRISYLHFKDIDPAVRARVVAERINFYDACASGVFCNLGQGAVDFPALKAALDDTGFSGWATVEQDRDPEDTESTLAYATVNLNYLKKVGLA